MKEEIKKRDPRAPKRLVTNPKTGKAVEHSDAALKEAQAAAKELATKKETAIEAARSDSKKPNAKTNTTTKKGGS